MHEEWRGTHALPKEWEVSQPCRGNLSAADWLSQYRAFKPYNPVPRHSEYTLFWEYIGRNDDMWQGRNPTIMLNAKHLLTGPSWISRSTAALQRFFQPWIATPAALSRRLRNRLNVQKPAKMVVSRADDWLCVERGVRCRLFLGFHASCMDKEDIALRRFNT